MDKAVMKEIFRSRGLPHRPQRNRSANLDAGSRARSRQAADPGQNGAAAVRQAGQPRIERRHHESESLGRN
ncbi:MAG: hypothetical protein MZU79_01380 [Anaerotruncus sp.]|nr:hypothetical protein [Anaerotruncus sp.]